MRLRTGGHPPEGTTCDSHDLDVSTGDSVGPTSNHLILRFHKEAARMPGWGHRPEQPSAMFTQLFTSSSGTAGR